MPQSPGHARLGRIRRRVECQALAFGARKCYSSTESSSLRRCTAIRQFVFGFDIDGVLTHDDDGTSNIWLQAASAYFGEPILKAAYDIEEAFNKTREEVNQFFASCMDQIFASVPVREQAAETLRRLSDQGCLVHLITHRYEAYRAVTEDWLKRNRIPFHSLTMCSDGSGYSKKERCLELGVQFYVDDKLENAEEVAGSGIYTLLFYASHNARRPTTVPLVRDWREIAEHIDFFLNQRQRQVR
ncbi:MAG: 5' nucleotidase, NT5C type [Limnochordia bacterium]|jgi:uncharacterized HAD superfamily protein